MSDEEAVGLLGLDLDAEGLREALAELAEGEETVVTAQASEVLQFRLDAMTRPGPAGGRRVSPERRARAKELLPATADRLATAMSSAWKRRAQAQERAALAALRRAAR